MTHTNFIGLAPRVKFSKSIPVPEKGVLKLGKFECGGKCLIGSCLKTFDAGYTYYDDVVCRRCAMRMKLI